jgi:hypothetical protein
MRPLLILTIFLLMSFQVYGDERITGRFVAVNKFMLLRIHRGIRQHLIFENVKTNELLKIVYLPKLKIENNSIGYELKSDPDFLSEDDLDYRKERLLLLRLPDKEIENIWCNQFDNYIRGEKNKIEKNEFGEDILQFQSTQFKADVKFDNLKAMPCLILDSLPK